MLMWIARQSIYNNPLLIDHIHFDLNMQKKTPQSKRKYPPWKEVDNYVQKNGKLVLLYANRVSLVY